MTQAHFPSQQQRDVSLPRLLAVLQFIDAHLDESLTVERLSEVVGLSKFHFHRLFASQLGLGLYAYIRLLRFKRAAFQLAFRPHQAVIDIAFDGGYDSPEAFARAFKTVLGQTPSDFRASPDWSVWHDIYQPLLALRSEKMLPTLSLGSVAIVMTADVSVAAYEHRGDPRLIGESVRRFIAWRKHHGLPPSQSATYNLFYDDPADTVPAEYRMDICAAFAGIVHANAAGVVAKQIPGGRCALLRHIGSDDLLAQAVHWLYSTWLPASGETLRDFPLYVQRLRFFPDVPDNEAVTDIFLPLATA